jgi:hypothetical protein
MKVVTWMAVGCLLSAIAAVAVVGSAFEILLGMLGPLLVTSVTWVLTERAYARNPASLTPLMIKAFGAKVVFFGVYVSTLLTLVLVRPVPFVASFTTYFIALHLTEALTMRRLFSVKPLERPDLLNRGL